MRKRSFTLIALFSLLLWLTACSTASQEGNGSGDDHEETAVKYYSHGILVEKSTDGSSWLVTQYDASGASPKVDATKFRVKETTELLDAQGNKISMSEIHPGQSFEIWSIGPVAESYPTQTEAAKIILLTENPPSAEMIAKEEAIQAVLGLREPGLYWAVKDIQFQAEQERWVIEIINGDRMEDIKKLAVDAKSGEVHLQPLAENDAFRLFEPAPESEVGSSFLVSGEARVFEAVFQWTLEDGHNILAEGHVMADQGAPEWGSFEFEVQYSGATNTNLMLVLYVASAKDGSPEHELIIPLKQQP